MKKIKYLRLEKKLTQVELAKQSNISIAQYQRIERGEAEPTVQKSIALAKVLNTTVEDLFGKVDYEIDTNTSYSTYNIIT